MTQARIGALLGFLGMIYSWMLSTPIVNGVSEKATGSRFLFQNEDGLIQGM